MKKGEIWVNNNLAGILREDEEGYHFQYLQEYLNRENAPDDPEELALTLNGKKRKLSRKDFLNAMEGAQFPGKAIQNLWKRIENGMQSWEVLIGSSLLTNKQKHDFQTLINTRVEHLRLNL